MKTVTAAVLALSALGAPASFAQTVASSFDGLSAAISLNFSSMAVDVHDNLGNAVGNMSASSQNLMVQVARGIAIGSNGVANFGVSATLGDSSAGSFSGLEVKATGDYALYGELGYALTTRSLAYGKFSINRLSGQVSGAGAPFDGSVTADGTGIGAGYRHGLGQGLYLQGEVMQLNYRDASTPGGLVYKPRNTVLALGVGYKF